jgi:DNA-binding NarL/FixJ family response regulator
MLAAVAAAEISVVVVDDHPVVRDGVIAALAASDGIAVVGQAGSVREAVDIALRVRPTVALIDLHMPGGSGVVAIRELARVRPETHCLVLSLDDEDEALFAAMQAGARGYLLKGARGAEIERGIRAAAAGELVFGAGVAERVAALFSAPRRPRGADHFPDLTDRELVILDLVARGLDNASMAAKLHLAPKTVRNQVSALLAKINAPDRQAAAAVARRAGLGRDDSIG